MHMLDLKGAAVSHKKRGERRVTGNNIKAASPCDIDAY